MQCSPSNSFTEGAMESIAIYSSLLRRPGKVCRVLGNPPNMSSERLYLRLCLALLRNSRGKGI